mmetsp:Transcript_35436/g.76625  ORF Transcript_35436/g.76625 Transcript_35436/m.76625 type:complete len:191 (+) Transcript_35436:209-781(+)
MFQRFKECTVAMPTWFLHRSIFDAVGGFNEAGRGTPEDMDFFYAHLERGGQLVRVDQRLVLYRYHGDGASQSVTQDTIFQRRVGALQRQLLTHLDKFSIWGGKEARKLFNSLRGDLQSRVTAFLDIHPRKVGTIYAFRGAKIPVLHWEAAQQTEHQPVIVCVKAELTGGAFEINLASLHLEEGRQYYLME